MASHKNFKRERVNKAKKNDIFDRPRSQEKDREVTNEQEENIIEWVTFYRRNIHRFLSHYLLRGGGIQLHMYQIILVYLMNLCPLIVVVACRAAAKSFVIAIYACARCVLYPKLLGRYIVICNEKPRICWKLLKL